MKMGKRNGILREIERKGRCVIDMPPRKDSEYMKRYKTISRRVEKNKDIHGKEWLDPTLEWLKKKKFAEILSLCYMFLVIDFSWLIQIILR